MKTNHIVASRLPSLKQIREIRVDAADIGAALDLQFAREHLDDLSSLVKQVRSGDYLATLSAFDQQYTAAAKAIEALPENAQRAQLASQLNTLEEDARQDLYVFLPNINLAGELATTSELGKLGETIPRLSSATVVFSLYPGGPVLISFAGSGIQAGAQLLIGDQVIPATGMTRAGQLVFIAREGRTWQPQSLGILNPDGTAAQTSTIHLKTPDEHGPGNGSGPGHGRGGKPGVTPTPTWPTPSPRF
jgi:hypothetical protein